MNTKVIKEKYLKICQYIGALKYAPSTAQAQVMLFAVGAFLLFSGLAGEAMAQRTINYNDTRLADSINAILTYIEGTFGAMVMIAAGIGAILSSAFGQYRAALGLLVVAVGAFVLRSFVSTFFNDENIQE